MQNESHGGFAQNTTGHATKIAGVTVAGKKRLYRSHYTQATFHNIMEDSKILYPPTTHTSPIKMTRDELPQIDPSKLLDDCAERGILIFHITQKASSLQPTQCEFNEDKVCDMIASPPPFDCPPIISRDNFVIDGHHRWLAAYNAGDTSILCIQINLNADQLIDFLQGKDYTTSKSIRESIAQLLENEEFVLMLHCVNECLEKGMTEQEAIKQTAEVCLIEESDLQAFVDLLEGTPKKKTDVLVNQTPEPNPAEDPTAELKAKVDEFAEQAKKEAEDRRNAYPKTPEHVEDEDEMNVDVANGPNQGPFGPGSSGNVALNPTTNGILL